MPFDPRIFTRSTQSNGSEVSPGDGENSSLEDRVREFLLLPLYPHGFPSNNDQLEELEPVPLTDEYETAVKQVLYRCFVVRSYITQHAPRLNDTQESQTSNQGMSLNLTEGEFREPIEEVTITGGSEGEWVHPDQ
ncbi:hypothetical protein TREMEDRAFT_61055 [Tremella mesenterica DSM 1558]|uniref:uncharacterized protein n=1 Tax=Tremella mesenterica (strain ATCC 24925 / CBS 8224 / DSM 1558 / NBRC 9311 / NRRL Y-6157 / RJB 2259-6 / UBC 559-6) TaxID=578456 RepID=UPI0003F49DBC|nr:uncharacterized protein TREMEDRAFT_61055 [Tremella mesenterica DSM 1558]EIW70547.1 hypothetical protein TREMEDRAFT_61055 [Tremella mesenterica DSM 1558]